MMVVVLLLIFTIPLVCWALLARSAMSGDRVGAVLTCCVLAEIAAAGPGLGVTHLAGVALTGLYCAVGGRTRRCCSRRWHDGGRGVRLGSRAWIVTARR